MSNKTYSLFYPPITESDIQSCKSQHYLLSSEEQFISGVPNNSSRPDDGLNQHHSNRQSSSNPSTQTWQFDPPNINLSRVNLNQRSTAQEVQLTTLHNITPSNHCGYFSVDDNYIIGGKCYPSPNMTKESIHTDHDDSSKSPSKHFQTSSEPEILVNQFQDSFCRPEIDVEQAIEESPTLKSFQGSSSAVEKTSSNSVTEDFHKDAMQTLFQQSALHQPLRTNVNEDFVSIQEFQNNFSSKTSGHIFIPTFKKTRPSSSAAILSTSPACSPHTPPSQRYGSINSPFGNRSESCVGSYLNARNNSSSCMYPNSVQSSHSSCTSPPGCIPSGSIKSHLNDIPKEATVNIQGNETTLQSTLNIQQNSFSSSSARSSREGTPINIKCESDDGFIAPNVDISKIDYLSSDALPMLQKMNSDITITCDVKSYETNTSDETHAATHVSPKSEFPCNYRVSTLINSDSDVQPSTFLPFSNDSTLSVNDDSNTIPLCMEATPTELNESTAASLLCGSSQQVSGKCRFEYVQNQYAAPPQDISTSRQLNMQPFNPRQNHSKISGSSHVKIGRRPAHLPKVLKFADKTLPAGWQRKLKQRKHGKQAGRWDVYIYSPCGVKFASRKKLKMFFEKNNLNLDPEDFDFTPYGRHMESRAASMTSHCKGSSSGRHQSDTLAKNSTTRNNKCEANELSDSSPFQQKTNTLLGCCSGVTTMETTSVISSPSPAGPSSTNYSPSNTSCDSLNLFPSKSSQAKASRHRDLFKQFPSPNGSKNQRYNCSKLNADFTQRTRLPSNYSLFDLQMNSPPNVCALDLQNRQDSTVDARFKDRTPQSKGIQLTDTSSSCARPTSPQTRFRSDESSIDNWSTDQQYPAPPFTSQCLPSYSNMPGNSTSSLQTTSNVNDINSIQLPQGFDDVVLSKEEIFNSIVTDFSGALSQEHRNQNSVFDNIYDSRVGVPEKKSIENPMFEQEFDKKLLNKAADGSTFQQNNQSHMVGTTFRNNMYDASPLASGSGLSTSLDIEHSNIGNTTNSQIVLESNSTSSYRPASNSFDSSAHFISGNDHVVKDPSLLANQIINFGSPHLTFTETLPINNTIHRPFEPVMSAHQHPKPTTSFDPNNSLSLTSQQSRIPQSPASADSNNCSSNEMWNRFQNFSHPLQQSLTNSCQLATSSQSSPPVISINKQNQKNDEQDSFRGHAVGESFNNRVTAEHQSIIFSNPVDHSSSAFDMYENIQQQFTLPQPTTPLSMIQKRSDVDDTSHEFDTRLQSSSTSSRLMSFDNRGGSDTVLDPGASTSNQTFSLGRTMMNVLQSSLSDDLYATSVYDNYFGGTSGTDVGSVPGGGNNS